MQPSVRRGAALGLLILSLVACAGRGEAQAGRPAGLFADRAVTAAPAQAGSVEDTLRAVVQHANEAQQRAFAQGDPSPMRDDATDDYYQEMVRTNRGLADGGVTAIELLGLEWGPVSVDGSRAELTTFETWRTTTADGATLEARERNVYSLVEVDGAWKIQADAHPDAGGASTSGTQPAPAPSSPGAPTTRSSPPNAGESRNWSGYAARGGDFTAVSGGWTVPRSQVSGSFGGSAAWVGIGGLGSRDLVQAGTSATVSGDGQVRYEAWVETLPGPSRTVPLTVRPGDQVTVSIAEESTDQWKISITNGTTGRTYSTTEQYHSTHSSAEWVQEAPSAGRRQIPIDDFGTVSFTAGSAVENGRTLTIAETGARPITMIDGAGRPIAVPTALGSDGASFSVNRTDTPAVAPSTGRSTGRRGRSRLAGFPGLGG